MAQQQYNYGGQNPYDQRDDGAGGYGRTQPSYGANTGYGNQNYGNQDPYDSYGGESWVHPVTSIAQIC
jgi:hypothetical protein